MCAHERLTDSNALLIQVRLLLFNAVTLGWAHSVAFYFFSVCFSNTRGYQINFALGYLAGAHLRFYLLAF